MSANVMRYLALIVIISVPAQLSAQHEDHQYNSAGRVAAPVHITGVVECADGPTLPGAIIQLFGATNGDVPKASAIADQAGRFHIAVAPGLYRARFSFLGHASLEKQLEAIAGATTALGNVRLDISAVEIDALVATAEKDRIRLRAGQTVFDAKQAAAAAGGTVADALRNVPGLEVSAGGELRMRGSTNVLVLINGQRTVLKDAALVAFLRQMPASRLQKIETTTSVSATQDADGSAGLVNIEFESSAAAQQTSYSVAASAATAQQYTASGSYAGTLGKGADWDAGYAFSSLRPQTISHTMRDNWLAPPTLRTSHQLSVARATHRLHSVYAGSIVRIGTGNSLNGRIGYSWMKGSYDNRTDFADISSLGTNSAEYAMASTLAHTIPVTDASLGWRYRGAGRRHFSIASEIRAAGGKESFRGNYVADTNVRFLETAMDSRRSEYVIKNELAVDVLAARLTVGQQTRWRSVAATYDAVRTDSVEAHSFTHDESVNAAYASVARIAGRWYIEAGARTEASNERVATTDESPADRNALRFFPSVRLHWPHEVDAPFRYHFAYGRRIDRPQSAMLNPYSMGEDDMNSFIGNPLLRPEVTDQLEFGIERIGARTTVVVTPFVRATTNPLRLLKAVTASGRSTTTWTNLPRARAFGADISLNARVSDALRAHIAGNLYRLSSAHQSGESSTGGSYVSVRASIDARITPQTTLQLFAYRRGAEPVEQGEILPSGNADIAVSQSLGKAQRGLLTLRISDAFNSNKLAFRVSDETFKQQSDRKVTSRMVVLSFSWAVGKQQQEDSADQREQKSHIF